MPNGEGVWHIVWGGGSFLPFSPLPSVTPSCCGVLFFLLAASMSLSKLGLATRWLPIKSRLQTWPCHILGSHKGWFLRNRCLPYVDVLKGGFFHSSSAMRASGRPRSALEHLEYQQTCFIMAPKTGSKKPVETWRPERDLDCTRSKVGSRERKTCINTYAHASASQICLQNLCGQQ